ncbi:hypothetical protein [Streptosporangium sp. NPDC051022]|uniref:hypothetical protein n=1 Tax=Streptosporangium sp. NPDC051022 TaxID=3155752 RepID=UPI00341F3EA0
MAEEVSPDLAARLRAELYTILDGGPTELDELRETAVTRLGDRHQTCFLIAAKCERAHSGHRPAHWSLEAWTELLASARNVLAPLDPVLMEIVSARNRWLGRRAEPGDPDEAVRSQAAELRNRETGLRSDDHWTGVARLDLAAALVERARLTRVAGDGGPPPEADLGQAYGLADQEVTRRARLHGDDHLFTWRAREMRGAALVGLAAHGADSPIRHDQAMNVAEMTLSFVTGRRAHSDSHLMGVWLLRAEALLLAGMFPAGERAGRKAVALAAVRPGDWSGGVAPGGPWLALAAALAGRGDLGGARLAAGRAVRERNRWFPVGSLYRAEARCRLDSLEDRTGG